MVFVESDFAFDLERLCRRHGVDAVAAVQRAREDGTARFLLLGGGDAAAHLGLLARAAAVFARSWGPQFTEAFARAGEELLAAEAERERTAAAVAPETRPN